MVEGCVISHSIFDLSILNGKVDLVLKKEDSFRVDSFLSFIGSKGLNVLDPKLGALVSKERTFFTELSRVDTLRKIDSRKSVLLHEITRIA